MAKYNLPDHETMVNQIVDAVNKASYAERYAGLTWYGRARQQCERLADEHKVSVETAVGVVAALSPSCPWEKNLEDACKLMCEGKFARVTTYSTNRNKAWAIYRTGKPQDWLSGPKVNAFYNCILDPEDDYSVCVDRWAIRVVNAGQEIPLTEKRYNAIADAYRDAAQRLGLLPSQAQAISWLVYRNGLFGHQLSLPGF
jgi:hypothetical protein